MTELDIAKMILADEAAKDAEDDFIESFENDTDDENIFDLECHSIDDLGIDFNN